MLWLIWIAIMLLTPVVAGIGVWRETRMRRAEATAAELQLDSKQ
jgi:hypothetical protein